MALRTPFGVFVLIATCTPRLAAAQDVPSWIVVTAADRGDSVAVARAAARAREHCIRPAIPMAREC